MTVEKKKKMVEYGIHLLGVEYYTYIITYYYLILSMLYPCIWQTVIFFIHSYVGSGSSSTKVTEDKIHIYSVATGLLYERFLR